MAVTRLLGQMAIRTCVVAAVAFVFTGWRPFRRLLVSCADRREKFALIFIFGIRGIMGTYSGVPVLGAIADHRAHAVRTALGILTALRSGPLWAHSCRQCAARSLTLERSATVL